MAHGDVIGGHGPVAGRDARPGVAARFAAGLLHLPGGPGNAAVVAGQAAFARQHALVRHRQRGLVAGVGVQRRQPRQQLFQLRQRQRAQRLRAALGDGRGEGNQQVDTV